MTVKPKNKSQSHPNFFLAFLDFEETLNFFFSLFKKGNKLKRKTNSKQEDSGSLGQYGKYKTKATLF